MQSNFNQNYISFYLTILNFFLILFLIFLLPYSDQPDFLVQAQKFDIFRSMPKHELLACEVANQRSSFFYSFEGNCHSIELNFGRFSFLFKNLSIFVFAIVIATLINPNKSAVRTNSESFLGLMSVPSFVYSLSWLSHESLFSSVAVTFFLLKKRIFQIVLISCLFFIDKGNSFVILLYLLYSTIFSISRRFGYLFLVSMPLIALYLKYPLLKFLFNFDGISGKAQAIYAKHLNKSKQFQFPYLGPFICMTSMYFMTAMGFKPFLAYIFLFSNLIFSAGSRMLKNLQLFLIDFKDSITAFSFISFITFALPDYAYFKYYVFLLPVFLKDLISTFGLLNVLKILAFSNILAVISALFMLAR